MFQPLLRRIYTRSISSLRKAIKHINIFPHENLLSPIATIIKNDRDMCKKERWKVHTYEASLEVTIQTQNVDPIESASMEPFKKSETNPPMDKTINQITLHSSNDLRYTTVAHLRSNEYHIRSIHSLPN